ncbi:fimbrial protein [Proteus mirabilis]|uniref:fimbrial protein n=1 Tax=Proteus mirabilis TaxID=584 RepID=UPI00163B266A|nr:type 1 fimbrial protein [Proteus mirabilis]MBS3827155.1 type 1 fimbrial protein [Proteus mirabilis]MBS3837968.1 type 1 fimbrial protein [Proteus mirabilis]MDC9788067.1 type 1 fimbrial protein [Proteus mirabilis]
MKKSLFSLLILSTLSLSTQAIARHVTLDAKDITIQGRVVKKDAPTCQVQPVGTVKLPNAEIDALSTPFAYFSINFTDCDKPKGNKKVKVVFKPQADSYLTNTNKGADATNARVALLDYSKNEPIPLNGNQNERTFSSDYISDYSIGASIMFLLKYEGPGGSDKVTEGVFSSTLSFDAYVTDDIVEVSDGRETMQSDADGGESMQSNADED